MRNALTAALVAALVSSAGTFAASHYVITSQSQIAPGVRHALHGLKGERGATGTEANMRVVNVPGQEGPRGPSGATGVTGPQGYVGNRGSEGERGERGERGPTGPGNGERGPTGPVGGQGPPGAAGSLGDTVEVQGEVSGEGLLIAKATCPGEHPAMLSTGSALAPNDGTAALTESGWREGNTVVAASDNLRPGKVKLLVRAECAQ